MDYLTNGEDGIDFINIFSKGKTSLGRFLSNFAHSPIEFQGRKFGSIEAVWYWYTTDSEEVVSLYGYNAKSAGKEKTKIREIDEQLIKDAIDIKLKTYPERMRELAESSLPLCHFYQYGTLRKDGGYRWIVEHIEERRKLLKEYYKITSTSL